MFPWLCVPLRHWGTFHLSYQAIWKCSYGRICCICNHCFYHGYHVLLVWDLVEGPWLTHNSNVKRNTSDFTFKRRMCMAAEILLKYKLAWHIPGILLCTKHSSLKNHPPKVMVTRDTYIAGKWRLLTRMHSLGNVTAILECSISHGIANSLTSAIHTSYIYL